MNSFVRWMFAVGCLLYPFTPAWAQGSGVAAMADDSHLWATAKAMVVEIESYGETTCVGGEVIAPWVCSPGTVVQLVRGAVLWHQIWDLEGPAAEMFNGMIRSIHNWNSNATHGGGGTFEWTIENLGKWEGTWVLNAVGRGVGSWTFACHGSDGLEGFHMQGEGYSPEGVDYGVMIMHVQAKQK